MVLPSPETFLATGRDEDLPVVDAHHHVWDLSRNRHPWLSDEPPSAFRYGDTAPLRRNYLPADYRQDAAGQNIVATVFMEAEHDPADPLRETAWVHEVAARDGLPQAMAGAAFLDREDAAEVIRGQAAFPLVRSLRHKPRGVPRPEAHDPDHRIPGSMRCPVWRAGYRHLAESGLHFELQTPWWHLGEGVQPAETSESPVGPGEAAGDVFTGAGLALVGLRAAGLWPDQAVIYQVEAAD